jgi:hypothetical protein
MTLGEPINLRVVPILNRYYLMQTFLTSSKSQCP